MSSFVVGDKYIGEIPVCLHTDLPTQSASINR